MTPTAQRLTKEKQSMMSKRSCLCGVLLASSLGVPLPSVLEADEIEVGVLTCTTVPGTRFNLIIRSTVDVECIFKGSAGGEERYQGETGIGLGVDLNLNREEQIAFTVLSAGPHEPGDYALTGRYGGAKASATVGVGVGAAVLVGGGSKSFTLQPLALEGSTGLGVAAGIGYLYIEPASR
jgi:hypothetical protein